MSPAESILAGERSEVPLGAVVLNGFFSSRCRRVRSRYRLVEGRFLPNLGGITES